MTDSNTNDFVELMSSYRGVSITNPSLVGVQMPQMTSCRYKSILWSKAHEFQLGTSFKSCPSEWLFSSDGLASKQMRDRFLTMNSFLMVHEQENEKKITRAKSSTNIVLLSSERQRELIKERWWFRQKHR